MNIINPTQAYYRGMIAAYMESHSMGTPLTEGQINEIKEDLSQFCEKQIDRLDLSSQEKEKQKRRMKQTLEVYIQGVKDEMKREKNEVILV